MSDSARTNASGFRLPAVPSGKTPSVHVAARSGHKA